MCNTCEDTGAYVAYYGPEELGETYIAWCFCPIGRKQYTMEESLRRIEYVMFWATAFGLINAVMILIRIVK